jgi:PilZ domain
VPQPHDTSSPSHAPAAAEHRDAVRLPSPWPTVIRLLATPGFDRLRVQIRDVSVKGIGLLSPQPLETDARLALDWSFGPADRWKTMQARVIHVTPQDGGGFLIGCQFDRPLDEDDVHLVIWDLSRMLAFDA